MVRAVFLRHAARRWQIFSVPAMQFNRRRQTGAFAFLLLLPSIGLPCWLIAQTYRLIEIDRSIPPDEKEVENCLKRLGDANPDMRAEAALWLALVVPDRAEVISKLITLLGDQAQAKVGNVTSEVRRHIGADLVKMGPAAVEPLIAALDNENNLVRMGAIEALGGLRDRALCNRSFR